jgi:hypothetical protein
MTEELLINNYSHSLFFLFDSNIFICVDLIQLKFILNASTWRGIKTGYNLFSIQGNTTRPEWELGQCVSWHILLCRKCCLVTVHYFGWFAYWWWTMNGSTFWTCCIPLYRKQIISCFYSPSCGSIEYLWLFPNISYSYHNTYPSLLSASHYYRFHAEFSFQT